MVDHTTIADESLLTLVAYTRLFPKDHVCDFWDWFPQVARNYFKESDSRKMYAAAKKVAGKDRKYLLDEFEGEDLSFEEHQIRQRALEIAMDLYPGYPDGANSQVEKVGVYLLSEYEGDLSLLQTFLGRAFEQDCARNDELRKERDANGFYDFPEARLGKNGRDLNNYETPDEIKEDKKPVDSRDTSGNLGEEVSSPNKPLEELVREEQKLEKKTSSPKPLPRSSRDLASERIYDILLNTRTGDRATIRFMDGRIVQGALVFNPFKGTGRIINPRREISIDYSIADIASIKLKSSPPKKKSLDEEDGPSTEELLSQKEDLEKLARDD